MGDSDGDRVGEWGDGEDEESEGDEEDKRGGGEERGERGVGGMGESGIGKAQNLKFE